jgi:hypothetical protein
MVLVSGSKRIQVLKELEIAQAKDSEMIPIAIGTE